MKSVTLPQGTIRYQDEGHGPPVVFVHGLLVNHLLWRKVIPRLSRSARCLAPDLPLGSHQIPMKPDADLSVEGVARIVADFIAALDLRDVTLVGNDSGGAIAQVVAARHRERIGRLVLTTCDAYEVFPPTEYMYLKLLPKVPGLTAALSNAMYRVPALGQLPLAYGSLAKVRIPNDIIKQYVEPCAKNPGIRRDVAKFSASTSPKITMQAAEELRRFPHPTLLLWAAKDRYFPLNLAERLSRDIPDARLVAIDDARTYVMEDQPELVADEIARFVTRAADAPQPTVN